MGLIEASSSDDESKATPIGLQPGSGGRAVVHGGSLLSGIGDESESEDERPPDATVERPPSANPSPEPIPTASPTRPLHTVSSNMSLSALEVGSPITSSPAHTFTDEERFGAYSWTNDMPSAKETTITTFLAETCPLPEGQPMPIVQKRVADYLKKNLSFNTYLRNNKDFHNPAAAVALQTHLHVDPSLTSLNASYYSSTNLDLGRHYKALRTQQRHATVEAEEMKKRSQTREFVSGGTQKRDTSSGLQPKRAKSKWDQPDRGRRERSRSPRKSPHRAARRSPRRSSPRRQSPNRLSPPRRSRDHRDERRRDRDRDRDRRDRDRHREPREPRESRDRDRDRRERRR
eukprot:TRINITY_DN26149_c0_g1_i1.p1 TRINITY_DN26149_c0_g1~~TRINITY_DN26149_c0_g1_i1.p1  ORF type:complete len:346 (+),score=20.36 TRINITY_DN26149_c0_g1_i1:141-1178(+)